MRCGSWWTPPQLHGAKNTLKKSPWQPCRAKKILEWTTGPEQAIEFAIYLNDKYELVSRHGARHCPGRCKAAQALCSGSQQLWPWLPLMLAAARVHLSQDGRDPNGYVGVMWSMVGVHDMVRHVAAA